MLVMLVLKWEDKVKLAWRICDFAIQTQFRYHAHRSQLQQED